MLYAASAVLLLAEEPTVKVAAEEVTEPALLDTTQRYCQPLLELEPLTVTVAVVLPDQLVQELEPAFLYCHW